MFSDGGRVRSVQAASNLSENTLLNKPRQIVARDAKGVHVLRANNLFLSSQVEETV